MFQIFQYDFMVRAFIVGGVIAVIAPLVGIFLVVRRYSHLADTLAHVSLAGASLAALIGTQSTLPTIALTVSSGLGIELLRNNKKLYGEALLTLFLAGSLAFATIVISLHKSAGSAINALLFGSIATVTAIDVITTLITGAIVFVSIIYFYKKLFLISFDEELAQVEGIPVRLLNMGFIVLAAITISVALRIVGMLLVGALMVIPVITAMQYGKGFFKTLCLSVVFSLIAVFGGLYGAYYLDIASGGSIVALLVLFFFISLLIPKKSHGIVRPGF